MYRIALVVETSLASGRQIVEGISKFVSERNDWSVYQHSGQLGELSIGFLEQWDGDGIIARISTPESLKILQQKQLPVVDVLGNCKNVSFPVVKCNDYLVGRAAAEYFLEKGFRDLAYYGSYEETWAQERSVSFLETAQRNDANYSKYIFKRADIRKFGLERHLLNTRKWLQELSKPTGVLVASDQFAPMIFTAAQRDGIRIPEELSLIGVDNDAPFCGLCNPPLSSLEPDHRQVGYRAAELLGQLMAGSAPTKMLIEISPSRIYERRSSSQLAVKDPILATALNLISQRACMGIGIDEIARETGVSRSVIQRKFRSKLHRTIGESILDVKLKRAREMLLETNLSIHLVAERSGMNSQEYLTYMFRKHLGTTPAKVRKNAI